MVTSDFRPEVKIRTFHLFAMHPAIRLLWTWLWGRYHIPQNVFLVGNDTMKATKTRTKSRLKLLLLLSSSPWTAMLSWQKVGEAMSG